MSDPIWAPTPERAERANLTRLARRLGADGYHDLHRISLEEPERFWPAVVDDLGIEFSQPWDAVVDVSRGPEWARWFVGGKVNVARVCVHRRAVSDTEAYVGLYEDGALVQPFASENFSTCWAEGATATPALTIQSARCAGSVNCPAG